MIDAAHRASVPLGLPGPFNALASPFPGRADPFSPASLFASGQQGFWYKPTPSNSFADTAGTTPATIGGVVARINDLSGRGNHALQSSAPDRGTLQDGYIDFNGVNQWLAVPGASLGGAASFTIIARVRQNPGATGNDIFVGHRLGSSQYFDVRVTTGANYKATFRQSLLNTLNGTSAPSTTTPETVAYTFNADGSQNLRVNGAQQASSAAGTAGPSPAQLGGIGLGAYLDRGTPSLFFGGRVYEAILRQPALTLSELQDVEAYLNA